MTQNGKGSKARPFSVPHKVYEENWDRIFGSKKRVLDGWAPGDYWHRACRCCGQEFYGEKLAYHCEACAKGNHECPKVQ